MTRKQIDQLNCFQASKRVSRSACYCACAFPALALQAGRPLQCHSPKLLRPVQQAASAFVVASKRCANNIIAGLRYDVRPVSVCAAWPRSPAVIRGRRRCQGGAVSSRSPWLWTAAALCAHVHSASRSTTSKKGASPWQRKRNSRQRAACERADVFRRCASRLPSAVLLCVVNPYRLRHTELPACPGPPEVDFPKAAPALITILFVIFRVLHQCFVCLLLTVCCSAVGVRFPHRACIPGAQWAWQNALQESQRQVGVTKLR